MSQPRCRFCNTPLTQTFADLGMSPPSNALVESENINEAQTFFPLHAYVCDECFLVQVPDCEKPENIFNHDYPYFSSTSDSWLEHCKNYASYMTERFGLGTDSKVVEIASNDGYLLQFFKDKGISVLGVDPSQSVADAAMEKGVPTEVMFFGEESATKLKSAGHQADLIAAKNVLAHVPDINDFVEGFRVLLKEEGVFTIEFPHLLQLIENSQFDTIYHEHYSYLSFFVVQNIFKKHGMRLFDVEEVPTHGGSLRIFGCHENSRTHQNTENVEIMLAKEFSFGLNKMEIYKNFPELVEARKFELLNFLIQAKKEGKTVVGYGAPAKGNTFLNYSGVRTDLLEYTVDKNPFKQDKFLPGVNIPIYSPEKIEETKPDYVLILPWNLKNEIQQQLSHVREKGTQFVVAIPRLEILN